MTEPLTASSSVPVRASGAQELDFATRVKTLNTWFDREGDASTSWPKGTREMCERAYDAGKRDAAVRASGEPQTFDPTSLDPMDPRPFNMTLEDLRELVRTEAGRIAYVNDELDRLKALHDGEVQHLKAAAASPSDDGARQPQGGYEADGAWYCERCHGPLSSRKDEIAESWAVLGKSFQDSYGRLPDAIRALGRALKDSEAVNWRDYDLLKKQLRKDIEREQSARASDDGAARPQPAQEPKGYDRPSPCYSDEYYLAMAALDQYPVTDDGLGKSTSVIFRIHQLGHELQRIAALSSPSVAQGWTAVDGFTLDRIGQTLKTIGAITQDDAHWLIAQVSQIAVKPNENAKAPARSIED